MENSHTEVKSEICEFFNGRSVLITGAGGFIGGILMEHLLRLCPGIVEIFILLRDKKGYSAAERRESLLNELPFRKVRSESPEVLGKVRVVSGDIIHEDLGINPEDLEKLKQNVSAVFHCAASTSFLRDMRYMLMNNVIGTYNAITLSKKLPKLTVFVQVSTAIANSHLEEVREEVVDIPFTVDKIIEAIRSGDEEFLSSLERDQCQKWMNNYTFSKSIADSVILREALDVPVAIVRPSFVSHVWKGSAPGFLKGRGGFANSIPLAATGLLRVMMMDAEKASDIVPVDIVANTLIAAAWSAAERRVHSPLVVNCISSTKVRTSFSLLFRGLVSRPYSLLSAITFRTPSVIFIKNRLLYRIASLFLHHLPATFIDRSGLFQPSSLRTLYNVLDKILMTALPFLEKTYVFKSENFDNLKSLLNKKDNEIFNFDVTEFNLDYILETCSVNEFFQFENDDIQLKFKQVAVAERLVVVTMLYEGFLLLLLLGLASYFLKLIFGMLI